MWLPDPQSKHIRMGNWKQWKRKPEMENGNGKWKQSNLDVHVKSLINDHLPKTASIQRPPLSKDHIVFRFQGILIDYLLQRLHFYKDHNKDLIHSLIIILICSVFF